MFRRNRFGGQSDTACGEIKFKKNSNRSDIIDMIYYFSQQHNDPKEKAQGKKFYKKYKEIQNFKSKPVRDLEQIIGDKEKTTWKLKKDIEKIQNQIFKNNSEIKGHLREISDLMSGLKPIKDGMMNDLIDEIETYYCSGQKSQLKYERDMYYDAMEEQEQEMEQEFEMEEEMENPYGAHHKSKSNYYFGRNKVHFGRRGGKYIIKKGKKVYLN